MHAVFFRSMPPVAAALLCLLAPLAGAHGQTRIVVRGGAAFPMGDYDQTAEGLDLFARIGWTAGLELRVPVVESMALFASWDRVSNPVDEKELEEAGGITARVTADDHVANAVMVGLRLEGSPSPNTLLGIQGGVGLAAFDMADYAVEDGNQVTWDSARKFAFMGGFSFAVSRVELAFRFYPLGHFHHDGRVDTGRDEVLLEDIPAPVRVSTITLGVILP